MFKYLFYYPRKKKWCPLWLHRLTPVWSPPGQISELGCYTWSDGGWFYIDGTIIELYRKMFREWKQDKHLA